MGVGPDEYRDALRLFTSGVTVVTVAADGELHGMTATSFASVSLDPPLVLVCLEKISQTRDFVLEVGSFAVNVLEASQREVARAFALRGHKPFEDLDHHLGRNRAPLLEGSIASIECTTTDVIDAGDHDVVIAEVTSTTLRAGRPLVYFDRDYRSLA